ncbi:MAG: hypothetical protein OXU34_02450 [Gammaproteobacteria bacterium]|nr:hypothetical protein [Gammaproteobacteria bacterium]
MSGKTALIVIYNHHPHAENIPVVEKMYGKRFSDIYHLVPVAPGFAPVEREGGPNVIGVHGKSFYFHGWMAQGLRHYFRDEYTHYFFIHDDLILNPGISEDNFRQHLGLERDDTAFTTNFYTLHQRLEWDYAPEAYRFSGRIEPLPSFDEALKRFSAHGLEIRPLALHRSLLTRGVYMPPPPDYSLRRQFIAQTRRLKLVLRRLRRLAAWPAGERKLAYPLVGGYPDMVVVPAASIGEFCRYCAAFAEAGLFVAIAMPTALALSCKKINTHEDIPLWGWHYWPHESWGALRSRYDERKLDNLLENFPEECLFMHPVKLSP